MWRHYAFIYVKMVRKKWKWQKGQLKGGGSDLPKFKFSVEFPIGLHVILQLRIKKINKTAYHHKCKIILTKNPSRCDLAPLLKWY